MKAVAQSFVAPLAIEKSWVAVYVELIKARLACAADFLKEAMPSDKGIPIETGMADGRGMSAAEAKSGQDVARQAEPRGPAYSLTISKSGD